MLGWIWDEEQVRAGEAFDSCDQSNAPSEHQDSSSLRTERPDDSDQTIESISDDDDSSNEDDSSSMDSIQSIGSEELTRHKIRKQSRRLTRKILNLERRMIERSANQEYDEEMQAASSGCSYFESLNDTAYGLSRPGSVIMEGDEESDSSADYGGAAEGAMNDEETGSNSTPKKKTKKKWKNWITRRGSQDSTIEEEDSVVTVVDKITAEKEFKKQRNLKKRRKRRMYSAIAIALIIGSISALSVFLILSRKSDAPSNNGEGTDEIDDIEEPTIRSDPSTPSSVDVDYEIPTGRIDAIGEGDEGDFEYVVDTVGESEDVAADQTVDDVNESDSAHIESEDVAAHQGVDDDLIKEHMAAFEQWLEEEANDAFLQWLEEENERKNNEFESESIDADMEIDSKLEFGVEDDFLSSKMVP